MKTTRLIGSLAMLYAITGFGSAIAKEYVEPAEGFVPSKTRAEVRAELAEAVAKDMGESGRSSPYARTDAVSLPLQARQ